MTALTRFAPAFGRLLIATIFLLSGFGKIADPAMAQGRRVTTVASALRAAQLMQTAA